MKNPILWIAILVVAAAIAVANYFWKQQSAPVAVAPAPVAEAPKPDPPPPPPPPAPPPEPPPAPEPAVKHPIEPESAPVKLPALAQSDPSVLDTLVGLVGKKAVLDYIRLPDFVRHVVATVDGLPRTRLPERSRPFHPVAGMFMVSGTRDAPTIDPANVRRYDAVLKLMESVDTSRLVATYRRFYPLFEEAYRENGGRGTFNDRLVLAIDDMLAAPDLGAPVRLVQPKVLYEFADPQHEQRSVGQKMLMRAGSQNAARIKTKLRELRRLVARG